MCKSDLISDDRELWVRQEVNESLMIDAIGCMLEIGGRPMMELLHHIARDSKFSDEVRDCARDCYTELATGGNYDVAIGPHSALASVSSGKLNNHRLVLHASTRSGSPNTLIVFPLLETTSPKAFRAFRKNLAACIQ